MIFTLPLTHLLRRFRLPPLYLVERGIEGVSVIVLMFCTTFVFAQSPPTSISAPDSTVIYLVGDAGNDTTPGPALQLLKKRIAIDSTATVIFLGDNVYPHGVNDPIDNGKLNSDEKKMLSQLSMFKGFSGQVYMIPGNHDWHAQRRDGLEWVQAQDKWVNAYLKDSCGVKGGYFPNKGLSGPDNVLIAPGIRLIMLDSQWFLQRRSGKKVGNNPDAKKFHSDQAEWCWDILEATILASVLRGEQLIFAVHHPLISAGTHGAPMKFVRFLVNYTPFQLFGILGVNRALSQNANQPGYKKYRKNLEKLLVASGKNHIVVAGHEHNFQVWKMDWGIQVVSGSGSKKSDFKKHYLDDPRLVDKNDSNEGITRLVIRKVGVAQVVSWEFLIK